VKSSTSNMKILSDNAVTKTDLQAIDAKQDRQIKQLRIALAISFVANVVFSVAMKFFLRRNTGIS
ncbi:hypothetical protein, partial [Escherichia coli]|uniref:hypothetical protein n=1 Tax=Escherichia coli TaxID=562 RepID=UPI00200C76AB